MEFSRLMRAVHGIVVPLVTPLESQDRLDRPGLERVVEHVIDGGVSGLFILGTTGEGTSLSYELRARVIDAVCHQVGDRVPVLVGVTDTAFDESLAIARIAERSGAAAAVLAPPCYFQISQADLLYYTERFARESPLPVFLYNIPSLTKTAFELETVLRASELPGIAGLKDSSGDLEYLAAVVRRAGGSFPVLMGPEQQLLEAMRRGATGGVCGGTNLHPILLCELQRSAAAGDFATAEHLQTRVREIADELYTVGDPGTSYLRGLKYAMAAAGLCSSTCALPIAPFTAEEKHIMESRLEKVGAMI